MPVVSAVPAAPVLVGRIEHRVAPRARLAGGKRGRDGNEDEADPRAAQFRAGFVLAPADGTGLSPVPLVVPLRCLRRACRAAVAERPVRVVGYTPVRYRDGLGDPLPPARGLEEAGDADDGDGTTVVEVHRDGLRVDPSDDDRAAAAAAAGKEEAPALDLVALAQERGKEALTVAGVLDAVSPVLIGGARDAPFALAELYQPAAEGGGAAASATAVLRGVSSFDR